MHLLQSTRAILVSCKYELSVWMINRVLNNCPSKISKGRQSAKCCGGMFCIHWYWWWLQCDWKMSCDFWRTKDRRYWQKLNKMILVKQQFARGITKNSRELLDQWTILHYKTDYKWSVVWKLAFFKRCRYWFVIFQFFTIQYT